MIYQHRLYEASSYPEQQPFPCPSNIVQKSLLLRRRSFILFSHQLSPFLPLSVVCTCRRCASSFRRCLSSFALFLPHSPPHSPPQTPANTRPLNCAPGQELLLRTTLAQFPNIPGDKAQSQGDRLHEEPTNVAGQKRHIIILERRGVDTPYHITTKSNAIHERRTHQPHTAGATHLRKHEQRHAVEQNRNRHRRALQAEGVPSSGSIVVGSYVSGIFLSRESHYCPFFSTREMFSLHTYT